MPQSLTCNQAPIDENPQVPSMLAASELIQAFQHISTLQPLSPSSPEQQSANLRVDCDPSAWVATRFLVKGLVHCDPAGSLLPARISLEAPKQFDAQVKRTHWQGPSRPDMALRRLTAWGAPRRAHSLEIRDFGVKRHSSLCI